MSTEMKQDIGMLKTHVVGTNRALKHLSIGIDARFRRIEVVLDRIVEKLHKLDKIDEVNERLIAFASDVEASRKDRGLYDLSFKEHRDALLNHEARLLRLEKKGAN